jgi:hypothetical protein
LRYRVKPADGHPNGLLECEMKLGAGYTEMRFGRPAPGVTHYIRIPTLSCDKHQVCHVHQACFVLQVGKQQIPILSFLW